MDVATTVGMAEVKWSELDCNQTDAQGIPASVVFLRRGKEI